MSENDEIIAEDSPLDNLFEQKEGFGLPSASLKTVWNDKCYWNARYKLDKEERPAYDWLDGFNKQRKLLEENGLEKKETRILEIGSGNSEFLEEMYRIGYQNLIGTDFAEEVIEIMNEKMKKQGMNIPFEVQDARKMTYEDGSFEVVLDKGTSDAIFAAGLPENREDVKLMVSEVSRILKEGGIWFVFTKKVPLDLYEEFFDLSKSFTQKEDGTSVENVYHVRVLLKKWNK
eukprot:TRINITY_DN6524_c0_g1_i4.p1 TRINITY_DN6524_c0_g1~~TRINITY_DN6524_c0_g1_i4.p1  ORF type:complete len:231 (+),score=58.65 TRINITY_DN6524_c0_g1_i4:150-842(+)